MAGIYYRLINAVALAAAVSVGAGFFKPEADSGRNDYRSGLPSVPVRSWKNSSKRPPLSSYEEIAGRDLFGPVSRPPGNPGAVKEEFEVMDTCTLDIALIGTVVSGETGSHAIIMDFAGRNQTLYRSGEAVRQAEVKSIRRGEVVLLLDGRLEKLSMGAGFPLVR